MCSLLSESLCWVSTNRSKDGFLSGMSGHVTWDIIYLVTQYENLRVTLFTLECNTVEKVKPFSFISFDEALKDDPVATA